MLGILAFIIIFGVLVTVHEFGHFYFAKKSGILVREFAIGMGPKIFAHIGQDGTAYTIRLLPLGGYVRMAGWNDDKTEIRVGTPASISQNQDGVITRINLSEKTIDQTALPILITSYDLEDALTLSGEVLGETKHFTVHHDATVVEEDGTEVRIAPRDVQYQNASIWGRLITNFAGPMNNFILGIVVFVLLVFIQGGTPDPSSNAVRTTENTPFAQAGGRSGDRILSIEGITVTNWSDLQNAVQQATQNFKEGDTLTVTIENAAGDQKDLTVTPDKVNDAFLLGVQQSLKTGFWDKVTGGFRQAWDTAFLIFNSLKNLIASFSLDKLGGPVAMYQLSNQAAASGLDSILYLMAMISINLGIVNLIPIPALDGGKILINLIELVRRKPLKQETETYITLVGVAIMFVLMIAVTWNDIMRAFF